MATTKNTDRFRKMADKLRSDADAKLAPRETHTAKKLAQARSAEREGLQFMRAATLIDAYCDACEAGSLPAVLASEKVTKDTFLSAAHMAGKMVSNGYHSYNVDSDTPGNTSPVSVALRELLEVAKTPEQIAQEKATKRRLEIVRATDGLRNCDIPGFFPTPESVVAQMLEVACIEDHHRVLEPSAGIGSIVELIRSQGFTGELTALEINSNLCGILALKGIAHECTDFLTHTDGGYDRIVMNPPFERKQAIKHVNHAYTLLAPGGRLVAILPPNHAAELQFSDANVHTLPCNAFNNSEAFRRTGVSVVMVEIEKPHFAMAEVA